MSRRTAQKVSPDSTAPHQTAQRICLILICLAVSIFLFTLIMLTFWLFDSWNIQQETDQILATTTLGSVPSSSGPTNNGADSEEDVFNPYWDFQNTDYLTADFTQLQQQNPETIAWLHLPGTNINYPVVQHTDNSYYLNHSFSRTGNSAGWVFLDHRNQTFENSETYDYNTIIYAHGRQDGSMFGSLKNIFTKTWQSDPDHLLLRTSSPTANQIWQVFSIYRITDSNDYIQTDFPEPRMFQDFLDTITARSVYDFHTTVSTSDHIITLSTCQDEHTKIVLHAKLIKSAAR